MPKSGERPCGRILDFDAVESEFDEAMADWFRLGASMATVVPDGRADGPYGRAKCRHQEATEIMTANSNRIRREKREAERAAK